MFPGIRNKSHYHLPGKFPGIQQGGLSYVGANGESVTTDAGLQLRKQMGMQMREEADIMFPIQEIVAGRKPSVGGSRGTAAHEPDGRI